MRRKDAYAEQKPKKKRRKPKVERVRRSPQPRRSVKLNVSRKTSLSEVGPSAKVKKKEERCVASVDGAPCVS